MSEQLKAWWGSLSEREQQLSLLSGIFLLLAAVYWGAWKPLSNQLQASEQKLVNTQHTLAWVEGKATLLVSAGVGKQDTGSRSLTLQQMVNNSAREYAIKFSRVENKKVQIEVMIADVEFDQFIRWLTYLNNQYRVSVISTDISKIGLQGHIKVNRLLLAN